ncbi:glutathionylspermidine synthase family protein [Minwuia sp.]|uniref:glutathionylspermidine synthase family protein n=1 Tax=Minwuia sp. TaxID=2493630 RepID=UPI003A902F56
MADSAGDPATHPVQRIDIAPRPDWKQTAEAHGFTFHSPEDDAYWDESACYALTLDQVEGDLEPAVEAVEEMCFEVVERVAADEMLMSRLGIPASFHQYVADSWRYRERNLYGRMDFAYDGSGSPKLYEYNADTPTALYEASIFQWVWLEQQIERGHIAEGTDQFNSLHEQLIDAFGNIGVTGKLHLAAVSDSDEDRGTVEYLADCAGQAGLDVEQLTMEEIGLGPKGAFVDLWDQPIDWLFKLYPWEWLMRDDFGANVPASGCHFIEPAWKTILSNKGLLPVLWEMFEGHPNLLPAYFADDPKADALESRVIKPILGREGANISIEAPGTSVSSGGDYGKEGYVVQQYAPLPDYGGRHPVFGCWVVASQPAGLGIREDNGLITTDDARFVPHIILP